MTYISGVGFLDVGCGVPGTHLSKFSSSAMQGWSTGFYQRMADHMHRASSAIGYGLPCCLGRGGGGMWSAFGAHSLYFAVLYGRCINCKTEKLVEVGCNFGSVSCSCTCGRCGAPSMVCFAGKRQWMELLNLGKKGKEKLTRVDGGKQTTIRPAVRFSLPIACKLRQ